MSQSLGTATVILVLACAGCFQGTHRAYDGPARPAGEVARVSFDSRDPTPLACRPQWIAVDGRRVWTEYPTTIEMLPGQRVLEFRFPWSNGYRERFRLAFTPAAGAEYRLTFHERQPDKSLGRQMLESAGEGAVRGMGMFALPLVLFTPRERPAGHWAYVRIGLRGGESIVAWEARGQ